MEQVIIIGLLLVFLWVVYEFWQWIVVAGVIVGVGWLVRAMVLPWLRQRRKEMERVERARRAAEEYAARAEREKTKQAESVRRASLEKIRRERIYDDCVERVLSCFRGRPVILDSNIWMDGQGESLNETISTEGSRRMEYVGAPDNLKKLAVANPAGYERIVRQVPGSVLLSMLENGDASDVEIVMSGTQLDEITNIITKSKYGSPKNKAARCAQRRIAAFQRKKCIKMFGVSPVAAKDAYVDAWLLDLVRELMKRKSLKLKDFPLCIVTFDNPLVVRLRGLAQSDPNSRIEILDRTDIVNRLQFI